MENNGNITIYVISHNIESIKMAKNDDLYTPLFVGAEKKILLDFWQIILVIIYLIKIRIMPS